jgi:hypothetical protein
MPKYQILSKLAKPKILADGASNTLAETNIITENFLPLT